MADEPILVVDDDLTILDAMAELLELEGYAVTSATNGAEALDAVQRALPRLVLLDMRMPVLDGWGFARAVREAGHRLRIIVMAASEDARRWAREVGAAGHVAKPFELHDLLSEIRRVLEQPA